MNAHEGPQSLSKNNKINLKNGMIISNEPGFYKEGYFGIRIENLVYIKKNRFEELTVAPIEKELINKKILSQNEIKWLNKYHKKVEKNLYKFMNFNERDRIKKGMFTYLKISYHLSSVIKSILSSLAFSIFLFVGFEFPITR